MSKLTAKQQAFVKEYLVDLNATQAAIRAGYAEKSATVEGARLLANAKVAEAVSVAQQARSERTEITADMVLQQWWKIATADPNGLVSHRRLCCRYCHGGNHEYQWTDREYAADKAEADREANEQGKAPVYPLDIGGYGFDRTAEPHPDCPECHGEGVGTVHIADTRKLSGNVKALYAGAKQTSQGIEIKMRDQDKALELVAKHLGMFKDEINLGGNVTINVVKRG
jgi:phage terminase small subunit